MASVRDVWIRIRNVFCCQCTKDGVLEPQKKQPAPCVSDGPVYSEDGVAPLQTSANPQHDSPLPPAHAVPRTGETPNQNAEQLYFQRICELEEELKHSQSWTRQLSCRLNELEQLICPEVEWRNSVQPGLAEKLQLHLERSLLEKQELECRALRAEESIQDLRHEIAILQKHLQAVCPSLTIPAVSATVPPPLPPSPPLLPSPAVQPSSIRLLLSKMHKKSEAQTPPKPGVGPCDEHVLPKQSSMREVLDSIRRGVSLKPVCMSRKYTVSQVEEATALEYEQEKPFIKQGNKSSPETDSSSNIPTSNQTLQPLGSITLLLSSGTSSNLVTSLGSSQKSHCPEREPEDPGRNCEDDRSSITTSTLPVTSPLEEGDSLEGIACGSLTNPELDTAAQIPEDAEAIGNLLQSRNKSQLAVGKENPKDEGEVETVAAVEMCERQLNIGPVKEVAQPLGPGDQGTMETADLANSKHLSPALLDAPCPPGISTPAEDHLVRGSGQNVNITAASCMSGVLALNPNASQTPSAEPTDKDLLGTAEKQPPLCPFAVSCGVETEVLLDSGDLGERKMLPTNSSAPPRGAELELVGVGAGVVMDQSSPLQVSTPIAMAAFSLPGARESPVPAGPDMLTEADPAGSSNSKEAITGLTTIKVHQEQPQEAAAQPGSEVC